MVFEVKNKVFFVTGAASGIGAGTTKILVEQGAKHVAILDIAENNGIELQNELNSKYGKNKAKFYKCDVTNDEQLLGAYNAVTKDQGYIDVVVNNAGYLNDANYRKEIEINVLALISSSLHAYKLMRKDEGGRGGTIINISSIAALHSSEIFPVYFATKSAVLQFNNCLSSGDTYERTGVRVVTLCFGVTNTGLYDNIGHFDETIRAKIPVIFGSYPTQKMETAAEALVQAYRVGENGSVWLSTSEKPTKNITDIVKKAYGIMAELVM